MLSNDEIIFITTMFIFAYIFLPDLNFLICVLSTLFIKKDDTLNLFVGEKVSFRVFPSDIDLNMHMNNARYIRILNYTRRRFFSAAGIWKVVRMNKLNIVVQAQTIRYRKELKLFETYSITTRIVSISDDIKETCFYVESTFKNSADFVCAIHYVKYKLVGKKDASIRPSSVLKSIGALNELFNNEHLIPKGFVKAWEHANSLSSKDLNPNKIS